MSTEDNAWHEGQGTIEDMEKNLPRSPESYLAGLCNSPLFSCLSKLSAAEDWSDGGANLPGDLGVFETLLQNIQVLNEPQHHLGALHFSVGWD